MSHNPGRPSVNPIKAAKRKLFSLLGLDSYLEKLALGKLAKDWVLPRNLPEHDPDFYLPSQVFDEYGLNFDAPRQLQRLEHWRETYSARFDTLRLDPTLNTQGLGQNYIFNKYYPTPDAEIYASMIWDHRPQHIIEIGSGFSTLIARKSIELGGLNTTLQVIDPAPRTDIKTAADRVWLSYVEDIDPAEMQLTEQTLLFIDSSHICRGRGDVPFLFCQLIPKLPSGVLVHVHDIFLPYDYPITYLKRLYTEQYLLYALLVNSPRYEIVLTTHYLARKFPTEMRATFGPVIGTDNKFYGASFWFRVR